MKVDFIYYDFLPLVKTVFFLLAVVALSFSTNSEIVDM